MSKEDIIKSTTDKFHKECSKITDTDLVNKLHIHEDTMIKVILETLLKD